MAWKLFLDDERDPVLPGWIVCRTVPDAVAVCEAYGLPEFMSLDHDLGPEHKTGYDFVKWMVDFMLDNDMKFPTEFQYYIHSQNPVGAKNMSALIDQALYEIGTE